MRGSSWNWFPQGFSTAASVPGGPCCGDRSVPCRMFSNMPGPHPVAPSALFPRCDCQRCLQTLPNVLVGRIITGLTTMDLFKNSSADCCLAVLFRFPQPFSVVKGCVQGVRQEEDSWVKAMAFVSLETRDLT